jgi:recombination protein RecT
MAQQLVRVDERAKVITELFKVNKPHILSAAPKSAGDPTRLINIAYNMIAFDADLLACTQQSLIGGVFEALKLGITLGGPMQEGWLIPFKVQGTPTATLIVGYMGMRNIIDRAGSVIDMHPRAVHNGRQRRGNEWVDGTPDDFDYYFGDQPRIIHRPKNPAPEFAQQLRAVYIVANLRKGGRQMEVLEPQEIEAHKARSRAAGTNKSPWTTDYVPMALKTAVRKISKYLPKSNELLSRALDLDDRADRGLDPNYEIPPGVQFLDETTGNVKNVTPASPMDRLKQTMGIQAQAAPPKCDGNHGGPRCADPNCWNLTDEMRREIIEQDAETARQERDRNGNS